MLPLLDLTDYLPADDLASAETMPSRWYVDPAFLEHEKEKIFWKTWQPVGRLDMVARPGDYFACEVAGEPLVVTRTQAGALRAFYNVCRHCVTSYPPGQSAIKCKV